MSIPVSILHIVHPGRSPRHARGARARRRVRALVAVVTAVALPTACAPRQAIIESEPGRGGQIAAGQEALRADLSRLASAQEEYEADNGFYAARTADLGFTASSGVRVDIIQGDRNGWSAVASSGEQECGLYEGDIRAPRSYLTDSGQVACR